MLAIAFLEDTVTAVPPMSYETCVTIVLTALCAMLAILALGIGALAIWGYAGIQELKNSLREEVKQKAADALATKLQEYPDAATIIQQFTILQSQSDTVAALRSQLASNGSDIVAPASKLEEDEGASTGSIAADYPSAQGG
jgi:hypothetical protein